MKKVTSCRVIEGDVFLHPILIRYEKDGQVYERLTSAEEVLKLFEKAAQHHAHLTQAGSGNQADENQPPAQVA